MCLGRILLNLGPVKGGKGLGFSLACLGHMPQTFLPHGPAKRLPGHRCQSRTPGADSEQSSCTRTDLPKQTGSARADYSSLTRTQLPNHNRSAQPGQICQTRTQLPHQNTPADSKQSCRTRAELPNQQAHLMASISSSSAPSSSSTASSVHEALAATKSRRESHNWNGRGRWFPCSGHGKQRGFQSCESTNSAQVVKSLGCMS